MATAIGFAVGSKLLVLAGVVTWCVASFDVTTQRHVDDVIHAGMACKHFPGLAVAIVKDGKVVSRKGYGVKDKVTQLPVTSDTLFQIASLTKAFTAALLSSILSDDPHLKISTSLHNTHALPASFHFNSSLLTTYATIEDLLAHRTGVPRNNYMRLATDYDIYTLVDKLRFLPKVGGFRDSFYYNDMMYGLAAHITEKLGNKQWQQQVRERIFQPLGMNRSTFISDVDFNSDDVATPYVIESGSMAKPSIDFIKHWGKNTGSGSIFSSANDMAKWMLMLLNDGKDSNGGRVVTEGVLGEVFKPSNVVPPSSYAANYRRPVVPESFIGDEYGLAWKLGYYREYKMAYHSGSTFGYRAFATLLPEMNVGVVSLMTGSDYQYKFRTALHEYLMDVALGHAPWINSTSICTFPDPWKSSYGSQTFRSSDEEAIAEEDEDLVLRPKPKAREARAHHPVLDLHLYTGTFHHGAYGDLTVRLNTSTQSLELQYGIGQWRLNAVDDHRFNGHWMKDYPMLDMDFAFHSNGQGIVSVEASDFETSKPPVFFRKSGECTGPLVG